MPQLNSDVTVREVVPTLHNADRFVRGVLELLRKTEKGRGPCVVRLGITGRGLLPNIRIDAADGSWTLGAFDGVSFKSFEELGTGTTDLGTWSTKGSNRLEVEEVLRELRPHSRIARSRWRS
jgi:hypothetical protein